MTAAFAAGTPTASFTVYGATQVYLRYDGEVASGSDNHALTAGFRLSR